MFGLDLETIRSIQNCFKEISQIEKVILYGSRARGDFKNGSDIDITLLGEKLTLENKYLLMDLLEELYLPYKFDISIFKDLTNENLIKIILEEGKKFYCKENLTLKQGWEVKELGEVCEVNYGTRVVRKKDGGTIYPVYGGGGKTFFIDRFNRENKLIVSRFAMSEKCTRFVNGKFFLNDSGLTIDTKEKKLKQDFLNLQIFSLNDMIYSIGRGTAQRNLDIPKLKQFYIKIPPLPEQQKIVQILDKAFSAIDKMQENLKKNIANAKELFQSKLDEVFNSKGKGWEVKELGEVFNFKNGVNFNKDDKIDKGILTIDVLNMYKGDLKPDLTNLYRVNKKFHENYKLKKGDILIVRSSVKEEGVAWSTYFESFDEEITYCGFIIRGRPIIKLNSRYIIYCLRSPKIRKELITKSVKSTITNINQEILSKIKIPLPPLPEQQKIVQLLDKLQEKTKQLEKNYQTEYNNLDELRKVFLERGFCGEMV